MNPLVSVIIPVYNVEKYLDNCIKSVINQNYLNLEIIIVNDGSTDNSGIISKAWTKNDRRIKLINKNNGGLSDARNAGLKIAQGKYILFVDSDDWLRTSMINSMLNVFCKYKVDMVECQFNYVYDDGNNVLSYNDNKRQDVEVIDRREYIKRLIAPNDQVTNHIWRKMFKRSLLPDHPFCKGMVYEDVQAMPKILSKVNRIACLSKPLYYYRQRSNGIHNNNQSSKILIDYYYAFKWSSDVLLEMEPELRNTINNERLDRYMGIYKDTFNENYNNLEKVTVIRHEISNYIKETQFRYLDNKFKILKLYLKLLPNRAVTAIDMWRKTTQIYVKTKNKLRKIIE